MTFKRNYEKERIRAKEYKRSKDGLIAKIYAAQKGRCEVNGRPAPSYNLEELRCWVKSQDIFHNLYDKWVESGFKKMLIPSVDRIDDDLSYSFDNMQLMTWTQNREKQGICITAGTVRNSKIVKQFTKSGDFVAEYLTYKQAAEATGSNPDVISLVCRGKRKTAGGFVWKFKEAA